MDYFFTADHHYGHSNIIKYSKRPFDDVDQMNKYLIKAWNDKVKYDDIVYHLGDFSFIKSGATHGIVGALNGQIHLILGNHDTKMKENVRAKFASVSFYKELKINDIHIVMCHYPMLTWNKAHHGSWMLHGHSHGNLKANKEFTAKRMDVGVDTNVHYAPYHLEEVKEYMSKCEFKPVDGHGERD
jgi:calcineurin-like phosphoesterase family protein